MTATTITGVGSGVASAAPGLLARYEAWQRSVRRSPLTIRQRLAMAHRVLGRWPDPSTATPSEVTEWLGTTRYASAGTAVTYHYDTAAFFSWLAASGEIPSDPMNSPLVVAPRAPRGVPKPLSADEEERALAYAKGDMRAWLLLGLKAGLRASEIAAIRGQDVAEDYITVLGKGEKEANVPTHRDIWELAQTYPRRGWWFPSPTHIGHVAGKSVSIMVGRHFRRPEVDIPTGSIHRCRHTFATKALRRGGNLRQVQEAMRHSSPATTAVYTAVSQDELRALIDLL